MKFSLLCLLLAGSFSTLAAEEKSKAAGDVVCTHASDKRVIAIANEGTGCKVNYTKGDSTSEIGSQKNGNDFCEKLVEKVKTKLVGSGFKCD